MDTCRMLVAVLMLAMVCLMADAAVAQWAQCDEVIFSGALGGELPPFEESVVLTYDTTDGTLSVSVGSPNPDDNMLTTLEVSSSAARFIPPCDNTEGNFDVCQPSKIAEVSARGFGSLSFGNVLPTGLSGADLATDFMVDGSYLTGGTFDKYDSRNPFLCVVPEPSAFLLLCVGLLVLCRRH